MTQYCTLCGWESSDEYSPSTFTHECQSDEPEDDGQPTDLQEHEDYAMDGDFHNMTSDGDGFFTEGDY